MDRKHLLWQMTAEQFAAFDTQLYLDTHPDDRNALQMYENYQRSYLGYKKEYEKAFGPVSSDNLDCNNWCWIDNPWPWEQEAN